MSTSCFESISRLFASRRASRASTAHQATPSAWDGEKIPYLFVQSFEGGGIAPKAGEEGTYTVTLTHGLGQTLYFADRPSRDVGAVPTERFLAGLGFSDDNPPNAAIVVDDGNGGTDIAVVELRNPLIDPTGPSVNYDLTVLENWEDSTELGLQDAPADLANLPASFGPVHLFIDDCANDRVVCSDGLRPISAPGDLPFCYNYGICMPCEPYGHTQPGPCSTRDYWTNKCNSGIATGCSGQCTADYLGRALICLN